MKIGSKQVTKCYPHATEDAGAVDKGSLVLGLRHLCYKHGSSSQAETVKEACENSAKDEHPVELTGGEERPGDHGEHSRQDDGPLATQGVGQVRSKEGSKHLTNDKTAGEP